MDSLRHRIRTRLQEILRHPMALPCYLPSLALAFSEGLLIPVLPLFVAGFEVSYGLVGLALAGEGVGALLGDLPAGALLQRLGRKGSMLLGLTCSILSTLALFWAGSIPVALGCRLGAGFGRALYGIARHAYVADTITVASRGKAIALLGGVFRLGTFAGPAIGGAVATAYGLRVPFLVCGAVCMAGLIAVAASLRVEDSPSDRPSPAEGNKNHLLATLRTHYRSLVSAGTGQLLAQMTRAGRRVIIPLYAADVLGLGPQEIGLIETISSAIDTAMFYPTGLIMDRWGRKFAIVPSFLIMSAGLSLVPLTTGFTGLLLAVGLIGFGNGLGSGTMLTLGADLSPPTGRASFLGVWRLIGDAGFTGGPLVVGGAADLLTLQPTAWAVAATGLVTAAVFAFLVPETLGQQNQISEVQ